MNNQDLIEERVLDFLLQFPPGEVHTIEEWQDLGKQYGLNEEELQELKSVLESIND